MGNCFAKNKKKSDSNPPSNPSFPNDKYVGKQAPIIFEYQDNSQGNNRQSTKEKHVTVSVINEMYTSVKGEDVDGEARAIQIIRRQQRTNQAGGGLSTQGRENTEENKFTHQKVNRTQ